MNEIYNSTTHGPIPLSFTGRRLMQNLRVAIQAAIKRGEYSDPRNEVAFARGELAFYISELENTKTIYATKEPLTLERQVRELAVRMKELEVKLGVSW